MNSFDEMGLKESLLRGIYSFGFETPSTIQQNGIVPLVQGGDLIGQAQSGTGKTGAFSIGLLQRIDETSPTLQAIVLLPVRELAMQVANVIEGLAMHMSVKTVLAVGGTSIKDQKDAVQNGAQVMIGTPGRVYDLIEKRIGRQCIHDLKLIVLDEADEMLSSGFQDQVREIFQFIPASVQVCLFSATLNTDVMRITEKFLRNPTNILVNTEDLTLDGIKQYYILMEEKHKFDCLLDLYHTMSIAQCILYCNSRAKVEELGNRMKTNGFTVGAIHGQMEWAERQDILKEFRSGHLRVLISTDLLARGLDIQQVSIVINYDIPRDVANYIHRIGRSGRYGKKGIGINFVTPESNEYLRAISDYYRTEITEMPTTFMNHLQ